MRILELYARLAKSTSPQESLFTGKFEGLKSINMRLSESATGTAHFAIFQNGVEKISKNITAGQSIKYTHPSGTTVEYYINSYSETDLPKAHIMIS